jgi:hypothetical protein
MLRRRDGVHTRGEVGVTALSPSLDFGQEVAGVFRVTLTPLVRVRDEFLDVGQHRV